MGWPDATVRSACFDPEVGRAIWGSAGWSVVQELLAIAGQASPFGGLIHFAAVDVGLTVFGSLPVVAMRYRTAELLAEPYRAEGPVALAQEDHGMGRVEDADRLLVRDVRCDRRSPLSGGAA